MSTRGIMQRRMHTQRSNAGQGLVEYALIIALVAVVVIGSLILLGPQISSIFQGISNNL
jgi:pilus assembly protein Flp/PilA